MVEVSAALRAKTSAVFAAKHHERQSERERTLKKRGKIDLVLVDELIVFDFFIFGERLVLTGEHEIRFDRRFDVELHFVKALAQRS